MIKIEKYYLTYGVEDKAAHYVLYYKIYFETEIFPSNFYVHVNNDIESISEDQAETILHQYEHVSCQTYYYHENN